MQTPKHFRHGLKRGFYYGQKINTKKLTLAKMPRKKSTTSLSSLLDEPISQLHEEMLKIMEKKTGTIVGPDRRSAEAKAAKLVEDKIRLEYFRPPHEIILLDQNIILNSLEYMFDKTSEKYRNKMISMSYISRYFRQILTEKKDVDSPKKNDKK